jgi:hypothetical protein
VQATPSSQLAGHELGGSQVSPLSTTLLPQVAEQSVSVVKLQPAGQQPSPELQMTMALKLHATLQVAALPVCWFVVQALLSSQLVGHEPGGSQVSPVSTVPLPQVVAPEPPVELPDPAEAPPLAGWFDAVCLSEHDATATPKTSTKTVNAAFFMRGLPNCWSGQIVVSDHTHLSA